MSKDRLTQLVALLVIVAALAGSMLLVPRINDQRRDLQLTFAVDENQSDPPQYALLAAGLGSFRGVAVNALWYRAEMMKRDGRFAEANTLATWISNLQPRFPHVWGFLAWNMAYNISVETFTPQERYDWVNKGIRLLREQGIPQNPNAVRLYRELGWILFHKVGQSTDDVNWYYKGEFAREWEILLGAPSEVLEGNDVIRAFFPVALMADRYFAVDRPSERVRTRLEAAIAAGDVRELVDQAEPLQDAGIVALDQRLRELRRTVAPSREDDLAVIDELLAAAVDQLGRAERDAATVFLEENEAARPVVEALRALDMGLDTDTLRAVGTCLMYLRHRPAELVARLPETLMPPEAKSVLPLVVELGGLPDDDPRRAGLFELVLPFLRAQALIEDYNMSPVKMYTYMAPVPEDVLAADPKTPGGYGPLDWRHPHSHSLYWSRLGVEQYHDQRDLTRVDILNTQRQALHSLQGLSDYGTVSFNPLNEPGFQIDLLPDPDFIAGYFKIVDETQAMADDEELGERIKSEAFQNGEENFLQKAVLYCYLYGDPRQAATYYRRLIDEFGELPHNQRRNWYDLPLGDFVAMLIFDDDLGRPGMISLINSRLIEAFRGGLAVGNARGMRTFNQNLRLAQTVHGVYQEKYGFQTGLGVGGGRLRLPPYEQMVEDAFTAFMTDAAVNLFTRVNAYQTALRLGGQLPLAARTYRRWEAGVAQQLAARGLDPARAIPVPPDVVETVDGVEQQQGGATIQRQ